jgi:hypothetical protein
LLRRVRGRRIARNFAEKGEEEEEDSQEFR